MLRAGIVGWRGMVGSVLVQRMREERDFDHIEPVFFSTSQAGGKGPDVGRPVEPVKNAMDLDELKRLAVIVSCQGGDYTNDVYPRLRREGWKGYWIDAASALRMDADAVIILDPVNMPLIQDALARGVKNYIGGNCTVSLMLMGMAGLFQRDEIEWMTSMTYQAASGAGAANMRELVEQMATIGERSRALLGDPAAAILDLDRAVTDTIRSPRLPKAVQHILKTARTHGVAAGIHVLDAAAAKRRIAEGFQFIAITSEAGMMLSKAQEITGTLGIGAGKSVAKY
jgi:aspartate-semialdehyde dehydrogenase